MPRIRTAHKFSERERTDDVLTDELVDFKSLLLSPDVLKGLNSSGFERPSPIQLKAIPLGRCGLDLIAQAKSGTGKTCVFSVITLETVLLEGNTTQVLILAPTREIAVQIKEVITAIGSQMKSLVCHAFIGGLPVEENKKILKKPCHIAVGTPGRIKFLIENRFLKTDSVRLFILDEADKLLEDNFQEQINWIFSSLPSNKQMMAFSATYPEYLAKHLTRYMREPTFVRLNATDPTLQGIKQFYQLVPFHPLPHKTFQEKVTVLLRLLSSLPFHQCLVFSNFQIRAQSLCDTLRLKGWPSVFIAGSQTQSQRLKAMEKLKEFKCRVLISTDLTSRGIDAEHVNLVVNMDVPRDSETYLHRIGRAGRFGTQGIAVTFVAQGEEDKLFKRMEENIGITIDALPDPIPQSLLTSEVSNGLLSKPVHPRTASVEVDILKNASMTTSEGNLNREPNTIQTSTQNSDEALDSSGEIGFIEEQESCTGDLSEQESFEKNIEVLQNQEELPERVQIKDVTNMLPKTSERNQDVLVTADIQGKLQNFSHSCQTYKENSSHVRKQIPDTGSNCDGSPLHGNKTGEFTAKNFQDISEVKLQSDVVKSIKDKEWQKQSSLLVSSANKSFSLVEENGNILNKFQDWKLDSPPESRDLFKTASHCLTDASNETQGVQNKCTDYEKTLSPEVDNKWPQSLPEEDISSNASSGEIKDTCTSNDFKYNAQNMSQEGCDLSHHLPSVEEFERDFEVYLENACNLHHFAKSSPNSSEVEDELGDGGTQSEDKLHGIDTSDGCCKRTSTEGSMPSHHLDVFACNHRQEGSDIGIHASCERTIPVSSMFTQHLDVFPSLACNQMLCHADRDFPHHNGHEQNQYYTDRCCPSHYKETLSAANSYSYLHPSGYYNEWYLHDSSHNCCNRSSDNYNSCHNHPQQGSYAADWVANGQRQGYSAMPQHFGQSYGDTGSYQDHQWNMSWYNAYQRQTSFIKQFVCLSRAGRF